jgi:hypothetical protein
MGSTAHTSHDQRNNNFGQSYFDSRKHQYSLIIEVEYKENCPGTMNIYVIWDKQEQKRLSGIL